MRTGLQRSQLDVEALGQLLRVLLRALCSSFFRCEAAFNRAPHGRPATDRRVRVVERRAVLSSIEHVHPFDNVFMFFRSIYVVFNLNQSYPISVTRQTRLEL